MKFKFILTTFSVYDTVLKIKENTMFTATKFDTAEDKAKFVKQFIKFVESDFKQSLFTKKFYNRLSMTFGHIAHYDQYGFYNNFFTATGHKIEFLKQTINHPCYGQPDYTYCDAEEEIIKQLLEMNVLNKYSKMLDNERNNAELAEYQRLKAKFEKA
jgi:hypothetical protein